jgi:hypothetical protein
MFCPQMAVSTKQFAITSREHYYSPILNMNSVECLLEGKVAVVLDEEDLTMMTQSTQQLEESACDIEFSDGDGGAVTDDDETDDEAEDLSWRLDPRRSLSDWTIQVVVKGTKIQETYHVHKSILAVGPRRSSYFAAAFFKQSSRAAQTSQDQNAISRETPPQQSGQWDCMSTIAGGGPSIGGATKMIDYVDVGSNLSRIELHRLAAESFASMLDYFYSSTGEIDLSTENATALHSLAYHLEIKSLRRIVREFWINDLSMDNVCTYYQHARVFKDRRILSFAEEFCADHIFEVKETTVVDILTTVDPLFFLQVVTLPAIRSAGPSTSLRLSLLIAVYCNIHRMELDKNMFLRLTASSHLPDLEIKAARVLLEMEDDICGPDSRNYISSLKNRSIAVLSENWDVACLTEIDDQQQDADGKDVDNDLTKGVSLPRLYGEPLKMFASMAFLNAKKRLDRSEAERNALEIRNEELQREIEESRKRMDEMALQLQRLDPSQTGIVCSKQEASMCGLYNTARAAQRSTLS